MQVVLVLYRQRENVLCICVLCIDMYAIFQANRRKIFSLQLKRNLSYIKCYARYAMIDIHKKSKNILKILANISNISINWSIYSCRFSTTFVTCKTFTIPQHWRLIGVIVMQLYALLKSNITLLWFNVLNICADSHISHSTPPRKKIDILNGAFAVCYVPKVTSFAPLAPYCSPTGTSSPNPNPMAAT